MNDVSLFGRDFLALVADIVTYNQQVQLQELIAAGWCESQHYEEDTAVKFDDLRRQVKSLQERRDLLHFFARAYQQQCEGARAISGKHVSRCDEWLSLAVEFVEGRGGGHWSWDSSVSDEDRRGMVAEIELEIAVATDIFTRELEQSPLNIAGDTGKPDLPTVDLQLCQVRFADECVETTAEGAMLVSKVLEAFPDYFPAYKLFTKPSQIKKRLAPRIRAHIDTSGGKGYRWLCAGDPAQ